MNAADPRLPSTAVPSAYRLELAPDLETFTFAGSVSIDVDIPEATDVLVLNSIELTIHAATVRTEALTLEAHIISTTHSNDLP